MASVIKQDNLAQGAQHPQVVVFNMQDVQERARKYLNEIQKQANDLLAQAEKDAAQLLVSARQQALEQAQATLNQRIEEAAQRLSDTRCKSAIAACEQAVAGVSKNSAEWLALWREQTVSIAARMAEKLVRREMQDRSELLQVWMEEALVAFRDARELKIVVHPDDFAVAGRFLQQLSRTMPQAAAAEVIPDPQIAPGGCLVRSNHGQLDQQLETQLQRLVEQLS